MSRIPAELVDEVRAALARNIDDIFESCGAELRGRGRNRRTSTCPACGDRSRWDAVRVSVERGWVCGCCRAAGDAVKALALFAGLDPRKDFADVIRKGAELVGIDLEPAADPAQAAARRREFDQRRAQREAARRDREEAEAAQTAAAIAEARAWWPKLLARHDAGEAYLRSRGLDVELLIEVGAVRFGRTGTPAVALHGSDGTVRNIVRRALTADGPKTPGLLHCPSPGTLVDSWLSIQPDRDVVVTEGVVDALTACCAWPFAVVLGAHGVGNYGDVVRAAASRLVRVGGPGRLFLVFDNDEPGMQAVTEAMEAIDEAGLDPARVEIVDIGTHHDLNDAWCAGWRP